MTNPLSLSPINPLFDEDPKANLGITKTATFLVQIADAPIAYRLPSTFLGNPKFDAVLVPHRVAFLRTEGLRELIHVGLHVKYHPLIPHSDQPLSILRQLPLPEFVETATLTFRMLLRGKGTVEAASEIPSAKGGVAQFSTVSVAEAETALHCEARVRTPRIAAIGVGASEAVWQLEHSGNVDLHGGPIETFAVVILPKDIPKVSYSVRVWMRHRIAFIPNDWETQTTEPIEAPIHPMPATLAIHH